MVSSIVFWALMVLLLDGRIFDGIQNVADAKPNFLEILRSPNYHQHDYNQPYEPIIERPYHFAPQTVDSAWWNGAEYRQHRQQPHHHTQTNGKDRYNEICNVIHGIGTCHG